MLFVSLQETKLHLILQSPKFGWNCTVSILQKADSLKWFVHRIYGLPGLVETIRNAHTEFIIWLVGITVSLFLVETTYGPHWVYVPCRFVTVSHVWLKLFLSDPSLSYFASQNSSPPYVWSKPIDGPHWVNFALQTFTASQVWSKLYCGSLRARCLITGLPIFGWSE